MEGFSQIACVSLAFGQFNPLSTSLVIWKIRCDCGEVEKQDSALMLQDFMRDSWWNLWSPHEFLVKVSSARDYSFRAKYSSFLLPRASRSKIIQIKRPHGGLHNLFWLLSSAFPVAEYYCGFFSPQIHSTFAVTAPSFLQFCILMTEQLYKWLWIAGNLIPRHQELFYKNPLFAGVRLPEIKEPEHLGKRYPRLSASVIEFAKVNHFPFAKPSLCFRRSLVK